MSQDILDRIDYPKMLTDMGFADVDPRQRDYLGYCLFHEDVNTKSFSANLESKLYHCFGCRIRGNAIQLYAKWKNISIDLAKQELADLPEVRSVEYLEANLQPRMQLATWKKLEILTAYKNAMAPITAVPELKKYMNDRFISDATLDKYDVRAHTKWNNCPYSQDELVQAGVLDISQYGSGVRSRFDNHPILFMFEVGGLVTYVQGRMDREPTGSDLKYLGIRGGITHAFNHDALLDRNAKQLFICEGAMDALSMIELGYIHSIGIIGVDGFRISWLEESKAELITLAMDNDRAGDEAFTKISKYLMDKNIQVNRFMFPRQFKDINKFLAHSKSV